MNAPNPVPPNHFVADYFENERHALYAGWIAGIAMRNGLDVIVHTDGAGNYTGKLTIGLPRVHSGVVTGTPTDITVVVPPPPDNWTFE